MESGSPPNRSPTLLKGLFLLVATLVMASLGFAAWIVVLYWSRVGV